MVRQGDPRLAATRRCRARSRRDLPAGALRDGQLPAHPDLPRHRDRTQRLLHAAPRRVRAGPDHLQGRRELRGLPDRAARHLHRWSRRRPGPHRSGRSGAAAVHRYRQRGEREPVAGRPEREHRRVRRSHRGLRRRPQACRPVGQPPGVRRRPEPTVRSHGRPQGPRGRIRPPSARGLPCPTRASARATRVLGASFYAGYKFGQPIPARGPRGCDARRLQPARVRRWSARPGRGLAQAGGSTFTVSAGTRVQNVELNAAAGTPERDAEGTRTAARSRRSTRERPDRRRAPPWPSRCRRPPARS